MLEDTAEASARYCEKLEALAFEKDQEKAYPTLTARKIGF
jgi:hypothetical protein